MHLPINAVLTFKHKTDFTDTGWLLVTMSAWVEGRSPRTSTRSFWGSGLNHNPNSKSSLTLTLTLTLTVILTLTKPNGHSITCLLTPILGLCLNATRILRRLCLRCHFSSTFLLLFMILTLTLTLTLILFLSFYIFSNAASSPFFSFAFFFVLSCFVFLFILVFANYSNLPSRTHTYTHTHTYTYLHSCTHIVSSSMAFINQAPVDLIHELSRRYIMIYEILTGLDFSFEAPELDMNESLRAFMANR